MKTGRLFWGMLLLSIGLLLLLGKLGLLTLTWSGVWRGWPLILVFWGISLLLSTTKGRSAGIALAAVVLAIVITGFAHAIWSPFSPGRGREVTRQEIVEPMRGEVRKASFTLDAGVGSFVIEDTTNQLVVASIRSSLGPYRVVRTSVGGEEKVTLERSGGSQHWSFGRVENSVDIRLNPNPVWDLDIDVGAASLNLDLERFKVERLRLDCGAASVRLTVGATVERMTINVDAGASSLKIGVPDSAGCRVVVDAGLSSKRFEDFKKMGHGVYQTDNYADATRKIDITIDAGVSSLRVTRYHTGISTAGW